MARLGDFWHIATFKNPTKTSDNAGGNLESFATFCTTRGSLERTGGSRVLVDGKDLMADNYDFVCFYKTALEDNITKDTLVLIDNANYEIVNFWRQKEDRRFYTFQLTKVS